MALSTKQKKALELLTCGLGLPYSEIAKRCGISTKTLWAWRTQPEYPDFQIELQKANDARWEATIDAAREAAASLCREGNQRMVEFVLKNAGYNPTQKVEAEVKNDISITIDGND